MLGAFRGIGLTTSTPLACYSSYSLSREWEITGKPDASRTTDFVALKSPSLRGALRYHWCPIAFIVMAGSTTTSSIEYNRANDGIAMNIGMILGKMVRIISIVVPWTILCGIGLVCSWKCHKARTKIRDTKTKIRMRKKKISWCKSMIPCIIGVAASWDPNCHGSAASQGAIVRNRHSNVLNNSAIICLSILWLPENLKETDRYLRWFFQQKKTRSLEEPESTGLPIIGNFTDARAQHGRVGAIRELAKAHTAEWRKSRVLSVYADQQSQ